MGTVCARKGNRSLFPGVFETWCGALVKGRKFVTDELWRVDCEKCRPYVELELRKQLVMMRLQERARVSLEQQGYEWPLVLERVGLWFASVAVQLSEDSREVETWEWALGSPRKLNRELKRIVAEVLGRKPPQRETERRPAPKKLPKRAG